VLGPFALVLVWQSNRMNTATKWVVAVIILLYTALTAYYFYRIMMMLFSEMDQLSGVLNGV
jgi:hypothetical protein